MSTFNQFFLSLLFLFVFPVIAAVDDGTEDEFISSLSLEDLLNIDVTSATKTSIKLSQAPAIISVVTADDISNYDYRSLADIFRTLPGFDVLNDTSFYNAGIRGINAGLNGQSQVLKVMLGGQDMAFRPTTGNFIGPEFIPTIAIDRVEVIRGPMSALYGANAFLGVVNVIPKRAIKGQAPKATFKASYIDDFGNAGYEAQIGLSASIGELGLYAAISTEKRERSGLVLPESSPRFDQFLTQSNLSVDEDDGESTSLYATADYNNEALGNFTLNFLYQTFDRGGNFQPDSEPLQNARVGFENYMAHLKYEKNIWDNLSITANFSLNKGKSTDDTRQIDPFRRGVAYLFREYGSTQYSTSVDLNYRPWESLNVIAGLDYSFDEEDLPSLVLIAHDNSTTKANADRKTEIDNQGLFVQFNWQVLASLSFIAGARSDTHSIYDQQATYRFGAVYSYNEHTTFKLLTGTSFKAPPVMLLFGGQHPRFLGPLPNSSLAPQEAQTTEFNIGVSLSEDFRLGLTVYNTTVDDFAEYDTLAANPQAKNRGEIDVKGGEVEIRYKSTSPNVDAFVSASLVDSSVSTDYVVGIQVSEQTRLYPDFSLSAGFTYQFEAWNIRLFGVYYYLDERAADKSNLPFLPVGEQQEYFLSSYQLFDLGLEKNNLKWFSDGTGSIKIAVKNSFEEKYQTPGFSGIDVPGLERQIYLNYTQKF